MSVVSRFRNGQLTRVLAPGDDGYDDAVAGFDRAVPVTPDVVVDAQNADEVASVVRMAADEGQAVAVLGSGHGRLHPIAGGAALTLRSLDTVEVDLTARTVTIGAGCTWTTVVAATAQHGLAAPCGSAPGVGVIGYLLGGGLGPLMSAIGFSSDHVVSFEVVTPVDGAITVSADSHPDLFQAMRGGKSGYGVVTAVTVNLLPVSAIVGGGVYFDGSDAAAVLTAYADWAPSLPETSTTSVALLRLPPAPTLPDAIRGRHVVHVRFAGLDPLEKAQAQLADLRAVTAPLLDTVGELPYGRIGTVHGDPTAPMSVANGTVSLAHLGHDTVDALLAAAGPDTDLPLSSVEIRTLGPGARRHPVTPDTVGGRSSAHVLNVYAQPDPSLDDQTRLADIRTALDSVAAWCSPTTLINFVGRANSEDATAQSWTQEQWGFLDGVRRAHDPDGLFPYPERRHVAGLDEKRA